MCVKNRAEVEEQIYASCTEGMTRIVGKEAIVSPHVHNVHVTSDMNMLGHVQR
jgi:hypothetical protein